MQPSERERKEKPKVLVQRQGYSSCSINSSRHCYTFLLLVSLGPAVLKKSAHTDRDRTVIFTMLYCTGHSHSLTHVTGGKTEAPRRQYGQSGSCFPYCSCCDMDVPTNTRFHLLTRYQPVPGCLVCTRGWFQDPRNESLHAIFTCFPPFTVAPWTAATFSLKT